mgnify:CR=1 FL=1
MNELLKDMGRRIYDRRKQLHMTQDTLAELANITPQTVSTAELGQKAMRPETIIGICGALDISTDFLLRGIITTEDKGCLVLTPSQYQHLEDIINSYIAALKESEA